MSEDSQTTTLCGFKHLTTFWSLTILLLFLIMFLSIPFKTPSGDVTGRNDENNRNTTPIISHLCQSLLWLFYVFFYVFSVNTGHNWQAIMSFSGFVGCWTAWWKLSKNVIINTSKRYSERSFTGDGRAKGTRICIHQEAGENKVVPCKYVPCRCYHWAVDSQTLPRKTIQG